MIRITWITSQNLGSLINGQISYFGVRAVASNGAAVTYSLIGSPTFPRCLYFDSTTGTLVGRVSYQSSNTNAAPNSITSYTFTVRASVGPVNSDRTFTFTIQQRITQPYDNIYIKALLTTSQRNQISELLNNTNLFPTEYLYRVGDPYYGLARDVIYQHAFGIPTALSCQYANAVLENHYNRDITLGQLQLAIARDSNNNVLYEVVYSRVIDNLVNAAGTSISKTVQWPRLVNGRSEFYPASLPNMRLQVESELNAVNTDPQVLPLWMTSQQYDQNIIGYTPAFVLCYAKPGFGQYIINNIIQLWSNRLNNFQFTIDRIIIDRSLSYQYYGGATPTPPSNIAGFNGSVYIINNMNEHDECIYVPQNILSVGTPIANCGTTPSLP